MDMKKHLIKILLLFLFLSSCDGQTIRHEQTPPTNSVPANKIVGGGCDGCELMYVGMPTTINAVDTSAGWAEKGQKLLVRGTVYQPDGKTPAPNVIIYYWQTDANGYYAPIADTDEKAKRHGHIRGWVKTDQQGNYAIYTIRPAPYPNRDIPAHIHTSIKEPDLDNEYYIDEFVFDDDKLLTGEKRKKLENRGGSGILRVLISDDLQIAEHNVILGLHIPAYPKTSASAKQSGLSIGEDNPSFTPYHAWGPDKGSRTCPVCKYGRYHGVVYFVGNHPDWDDIKKWLTFLEQQSIKRSKYVKAYFVYGNEINYSKTARQAELEKTGQELHLQQIALTFVPTLMDAESEVNLNKINPQVDNTFIIYRQGTIIDKYIDLAATAESFQLISNTLDKTKSDYFDLPEPKYNR